MNLSKPTQIAVVRTLSCLRAFGGDEEPRAFDRLYGQLLRQDQRPPAVIHGIRTTVFYFQAMATDAQADGSLFEGTLRAFEQTDPRQFKTPAEEQAFWNNAYKFSALTLVVENYPIKSIRDRKVSTSKYPWSTKVVTVQGQNLSLKGIEQERLLERFGRRGASLSERRNMRVVRSSSNPHRGEVY